MARRVYKYELSSDSEQVIDLPIKSKILSVVNQREKIVLYASVYDSETETRPIHVYLCGTGQDIPSRADVFLGTVSLYQGNVMIHVFLDSFQFYIDNANKVEPKFKVGDWLCENEPNNYARLIQILEIVDVQGKERYRISRDIHNDEDIVELDFVEKYYHKFDIQDAKDGDVLVYGDNPNHNHVEIIMIFKSLRNEHSAFTHFHIFIDQFRIDDWCDCGKSVHPATKEQRDILFQKIKEAGYEWDVDKKELKKL